MCLTSNIKEILLHNICYVTTSLIDLTVNRTVYNLEKKLGLEIQYNDPMHGYELGLMK